MYKFKIKMGFMDGTKTTTNWIIAGLVALVVIIGGGWLVARERGSAMAGANATSTDTTIGTEAGVAVAADSASPAAPGVVNPTSSASGETVTVNDQKAGASVMVADLTLRKPSWIVIRDTKGWALGAAWFYSSGKDLSIDLLRNTVAGEVYQAVIYIDDGNKKFELHGADTLVSDSQGAPVSSTFTAK
jgi:hypothetical protein